LFPGAHSLPLNPFKTASLMRFTGIPETERERARQSFQQRDLSLSLSLSNARTRAHTHTCMSARTNARARTLHAHIAWRPSRSITDQKGPCPSLDAQYLCVCVCVCVCVHPLPPYLFYLSIYLSICVCIYRVSILPVSCRSTVSAWSVHVCIDEADKHKDEADKHKQTHTGTNTHTQ
jgi:hypothetical protein